MPRSAGDRRGTPDDRLVVGLVRGLHGLKGAVRVEVLSDDAGRFEPGSVLFREGDDRRLTVAWAQEDAPGRLVRFRELTTREAVESLRDEYLVAEAPEPLPEGSYYWHDVIGSAVATLDGEPLGQVEDVFRAGGGEVLVVRGGRGEVLVPAVQAVIREFVPAEGRITVDREALALDDVEPPRPRGRRSSKQHSPTGGAAAETTGGAAAETPTDPDAQRAPAEP